MTKEDCPQPRHALGKKNQRARGGIPLSGDGESRLCDVVEGVSGTFHSLNIFLLQKGVDGL